MKQRRKYESALARGVRAALPAAALLALALPAAAQRGLPGSLLFFAEYDNRDPALSNLVTVTNASDDTIQTQWIYYDGATCTEFNRRELLTGRDTLTVITRFHNPEQTHGFLYVFAEDPVTDQAIAFDNLIGTSTFVDGTGSRSYALEPLSFGSPQDEGAVTDLDADGRRDFDGIEYDPTPDQLYFPRFLGQSDSFQTDLVLTNLSGTAQFDAVVNILLTNDNEELFSAQHQFRCWTSVSLTDVTQAFSNDFLQFTNNDPNEIVGATSVESGWFAVDGNVAQSIADTIRDPAILGVLVERGAINSGVQHYAFGTQDNGELVNNSVFSIDPVTGGNASSNVSPNVRH